MGTRWGLPRSVAQIHALLWLSPKPLTADEIVETLQIARSNVSTGLRDLVALGVVHVDRPLGQRKDAFTALADPFGMAEAIIAARRAREVAPTIAALDRALEAGRDGTAPETRQKIDAMLATARLMDGWYAEVSRLPRNLKLAALRLGAQVARFLPKSG